MWKRLASEKETAPPSFPLAPPNQVFAIAMVFLGLNEADGILLARHLSRFASHQSVLTDAGVASRHLTVSVGLTSFTEDASSADLLLGNAELALAHARAKGHGSWHLYSEQEAYRESADRRTHWRNEVESALEENRFVLHFQPILHISSGDLSHYEALLRMVGQDGKLVPPGMFIDVAESTGLIRRIDRWVVEAAVKAAAHRRDA
jgi:predicted signal transduction protein with EAL and GGDEF domain